MNRLISLAIYLGIGAMCHAAFIGPTFEWNSAWTWGWLLGWPIALFIWFWAFILALAVAGAVIWGAIALYLHLTKDWRRQRAIERMRDSIKAKFKARQEAQR